MIILFPNIEKDTLTVQGGCVPKSADVSALSNINSDTSIPQNTNNNQPQKTKFGKKENKPLSIEQKVYSFAGKCYMEQLPFGLDYTLDKIRNMDKSKLHIIAIWHDLDEVSDGLWAVALEKGHLQFIVRHVSRTDSTRINTILKQLGIVFRKGLDDNLLRSRGLETVVNFAGYATYLTHETEQAIKDGKHIYPMDRLVSNLNEEEILQVREGYIRLSEKRTVTQNELVALDCEAYGLGYNLKDFPEWYDSLPFVVRSNTKMRIVRESYQRGIKAKMTEKRQVQRLCVFIQGIGNTGKTYASEMALSGLKILTVSGGKAGKFDDLRPSHQAIILDDETCDDPLVMADNYICHAYRRNKENPPWTGTVFIVTSNLTFREWVEACGVKTIKDARSQINTTQYDALLTRFFVCRIEKDNNDISYLAVDSVSNRGQIPEQQERLQRFIDFKNKFNDTIKNYTPSLNVVDYSHILEPSQNEGE